MTADVIKLRKLRWEVFIDVVFILWTLVLAIVTSGAWQVINEVVCTGFTLFLFHDLKKLYINRPIKIEDTK